jgi:hypothetical protein
MIEKTDILTVRQYTRAVAQLWQAACNPSTQAALRMALDVAFDTPHYSHVALIDALLQC